MYKRQLSQIIGRKELHFEEIDSTNDYAANLITKKNPIEGTVVSASFQTHGKGQYGRKWHSNAGENLMLSVILTPSFLNLRDQFYLNMMTSLAVSLLVDELTGLRSKVKWPNDVYLNGGKIGGILIKNFVQKESISHCILGIGINLNQTIFPTDSLHATSVMATKGRKIDIADSRKQLYRRIETEYYLLKENKSELSTRYLDRLLGLDQAASFQLEGEELSGFIRGVDDYGRLIVELNGESRSYAHGNIELILDSLVS